MSVADPARNVVTAAAICATVFVGTVLLHELAHALAWGWFGAEGIVLRFGRVTLEGSLPSGGSPASAVIIGVGPAVTALQALVAAVIVERAARTGSAMRRWWAWTALVAAAYVGQALLSNGPGTDVGRLLAVSGSSGATQARLLSVVGVAVLVLVGWRAASWFAISSLGTGAAVLLAPWLAGVVLPAVLAFDGIARPTVGMALALVVAVAFAGARASRPAPRPSSREVALAGFLGVAAWLGVVAMDRAGGLSVG